MERRIRREELAKLLGVSSKTIYRWSTTGYNGVVLKSQKFGKTVGYAMSDVVLFQKLTGRAK